MAIESRAGVLVRIEATVMVEIDVGMKNEVRILREPQKAIIRDISVVGIGIASPIFFPKGAIMVVQIDTSSFGMEKPAKVIGEVRYCRPVKDKEGKYKVGIKFLEIEKALLGKIAEYVERNKNKSA